SIWTRGGALPSAPCEKRLPTLRPRPGGGRRARGEAALRQRGAQLAHQVQIEVQVVQRGELGAEHLAREHQVPERPPAEARAGVARAAVLDRTRVPGVRGVADHHLALSSEERPVPGVAGGQDAIEEVISHGREADRKSTRLNSSHVSISYAVFCLKKK